MAFGLGSFHKKAKKRIQGLAKKHWENVGLRKRARKNRDAAIENQAQGFSYAELIEKNRASTASQNVRRYGR